MTYDRDSKGLDDGERNQETCSGEKEVESEGAPHFVGLLKGFNFSMTVKVKVKSLSRVRLLATPWTVDY